MKKKIIDMDIRDIKKLFGEERPSNWGDIPDIDLYMDQIVGYMERQHIGFRVSENLTGAMVNNYVKQNIMPGYELSDVQVIRFSHDQDSDNVSYKIGRAHV